MEKVISANNANRLFWLGRYAERGYLFLHLMRKAYDEVLDVPVGEKPYSDFLQKLDIYVSNDFTTSYQMMEQIYDPATVTSLRSIIERMMDNAIVLRPEIYSESFSYIELCRDLIRREAEANEMNITHLQPITDWLLAFWGSVRERVTGRVYSLLEIGRLVEHIDMNIRFDYRHYRITETWEMLSRYMVTEPDLFDPVQAQTFARLLDDRDAYDAHRPDYKDSMLNALGLLVRV